MSLVEPTETNRKRAPSQRSLATRDRILDAAEKVFAARGFDGATIRDIATAAGEPVGSVHHHGGGKDMLFQQAVARRADALSQARLTALAQLRTQGGMSLETLLAAFIRPFFTLSRDEPRWRDYARLVAHVSTDDRWKGVSRTCFDPTAEVFLAAIVDLSPGLGRQAAAEGFVFAVSAMLGLLTSRERIAVLGHGARSDDDQVMNLVRFCAAGLRSSTRTSG